MSDSEQRLPPIPKKYTRRHRVSWWGQTYTVEPVVADAMLGDGRLLLGFQPANTRPDYYLIRVDSEFFHDGSDGHDSIGEVIETLADQFGEIEREREHLVADLCEQGVEPTGLNTDLAGNEDRLGWPVLSLDSGYCWWTEASLQGKRWK